MDASKREQGHRISKVFGRIAKRFRCSIQGGRHCANACTRTWCCGDNGNPTITKASSWLWKWRDLAGPLQATSKPLRPDQKLDFEGNLRSSRSSLQSSFQMIHLPQKYENVKELVPGQNALVYSAKDNILNRTVFLKGYPVLDDDPGSALREPQMLEKLAHNNLTRIFAADHLENGYLPLLR